jgi:hypothetical protein
MPICERDPWRFQFFENATCPADINIPTDDIDCWPWFPQHRWVYDKLKIAESQGLRCAPHGVVPDLYPVFSKPIINLRGMGIGSRKISSAAEMSVHTTAGHMWMEYLGGDHVSTDCAIVKGEIRWMRNAIGFSAADGMFQHWIIFAAEHAEIKAYLTDWVARHLADYTGMINFETIGNRIIEAHLRFSDQWCDLYGAGWIDALVGLYTTGVWSYPAENRQDSYSVPLFAAHGQSVRHPAQTEQLRIRAMPDVTSLQITFFEDRDGDLHAMPPGGFRLGIINCTNLASGFASRREFATSFPGVNLLIPE